MFTCVPRFCSHSVMTGPTYSLGMMIVARMMGSRISSILRRVGELGRIVDLDHRAVALRASW